MQSSWKYFLGLLALLTALVWTSVFYIQSSKFRLIVCDVGQGDAVLATYGSFEILTDGGNPNSKAVECLSRHLPFWDRTIEVVVNTHPQADHYGGLIEVFKSYKVDYFIGNGLESSTSGYQVLKGLVGGSGVTVINPSSGTSIRYGKIHYDIFYPTKEIIDKFSINEDSNLTGRSINNLSNVLGAYTSKNDPNDFSIQAVLSFGNFDALLTGDIGRNMKNEVISQFLISSLSKSIEYIKIPHHGSKYGLVSDYLKEIETPALAVISVGSKNSYGHPTQEVLKLLSDKGIKLYRTDVDGDVVVESDGVNYWVK